MDESSDSVQIECHKQAQAMKSPVDVNEDPVVYDKKSNRKNHNESNKTDRPQKHLVALIMSPHPQPL
jgi:hypothetical protein